MTLRLVGPTCLQERRSQPGQEVAPRIRTTQHDEAAQAQFVLASTGMIAKIIN